MRHDWKKTETSRLELRLTISKRWKIYATGFYGSFPPRAHIDLFLQFDNEDIKASTYRDGSFSAVQERSIASWNQVPFTDASSLCDIAEGLVEQFIDKLALEDT